MAVTMILDYRAGWHCPDTLSTGRVDAAVALAGFRDGFYRCLTRRARDAVFELARRH